MVPALPPGSSSGLGRKTIRHVCAHSREHSRVVTQAALDDTYRRATAAGLDRVSLRHSPATLCKTRDYNRIAPRSEALPKCRSLAVPSRTRRRE